MAYQCNVWPTERVYKSLLGAARHTIVDICGGPTPTCMDKEKRVQRNNFLQHTHCKSHRDVGYSQDCC
jgi:hypothetical protein